MTVQRARILGSGVIGLSVAIELSLNGVSCEVVSRTANSALLPMDASDKACSIWYPILLGGNEDIQQIADGWATDTYVMLSKLAREWPDAVRAVSEIEIIDNQQDFDTTSPSIAQIPDFTKSKGGVNLPSDAYGTWRFTSYIVAMPRYLARLREWALELGVVFTERQVDGLTPQLLDPELGPLINCLGLGAGKIANDYSMRPVKGHLLFFDPVDLPFAIGRYDYAIMPRTDGLAVGVLFIKQFEDLSPKRVDRDRILEEIHSWQRNDVLGLGLSSLNLSVGNIRREVTGLRPYRPDGPRVEVETVGQQTIVHNYGHGGSGVSLSWGCAYRVNRLLTGLSR